MGAPGKTARRSGVGTARGLDHRNVTLRGGVCSSFTPTSLEPGRRAALEVTLRHRGGSEERIGVIPEGAVVCCRSPAGGELEQKQALGNAGIRW